MRNIPNSTNKINELNSDLYSISSSFEYLDAITIEDVDIKINHLK